MIEPDNLDNLKKKKLKSVFNNSEDGGTIQVFITRKSGKGGGASSRSTPVNVFLSKIPYIKNYPTTKAIGDALTPKQKEYIERYDSKSMTQEDLQSILLTMTDDQLDNLLLAFQSKYRDDILRYLLKKANQWTDISEPMLNNASE